MNKLNIAVNVNVVNVVKTVFGELITKFNLKVNAIYISNLASKTQYDSDKEGLEKDIGGVENKMLDKINF